MNGKQLRQAMMDRTPVFGTLITSASPKLPQRVRKMGLDFVFIDMEHVPMDREIVSWMCQLYHALGIAPLVRIPSPSPDIALQAMDGGACGVIVPYIESREQVQALVGAVKYRPLKGNKLKRILNGEEQCEPELAQYLERYNEQISLIVQIESVDGMEALADILRVPGLDMIFIGPHDLSCSLGVSEQYEHPLFEAAVQKIVQQTLASRVGVGIQFNKGTAQEIAWGKQGLHLFSHKSDGTGFIETVGADIDAIKKALMR